MFEDDGVLTVMNNYGPDPMEFDLLLDGFRSDVDKELWTAGSGASAIRTTVPDLASWKFNFNKGHPNLLDRLQPILESEPVIIAGGSVLRALTAGEGMRRGKLVGKPGDIDMFICTQSPEEASRIAKRIFFAVAEEGERTVAIRSAGVISLERNRRLWTGGGFTGDDANSKMVDIVLRLYESPAEVLLGFDCDCCCVGYDGTHVWALPRAVRAIQYGVNVLNPLHAWPSKASYEFRLVKYAARGYPIAVPGWQHLDVDWRKVHQIQFTEARGLARLLRIVAALESGIATKLKAYTYADWNIPVVGTTTAGLGTTAWLQQMIRPTFGKDQIDALWIGCTEYNHEPCEYTGFVKENCVYPRQAEMTELWDATPIDLEANWAVIENCTNEGLRIPPLLSEAWDASKRSREYLNAGEYDLDARYFAHAAKSKDTP